jgi:hypothetical protein
MSSVADISLSISWSHDNMAQPSVVADVELDVIVWWVRHLVEDIADTVEQRFGARVVDFVPVLGHERLHVFWRDVIIGADRQRIVSFGW